MAANKAKQSRSLREVWFNRITELLESAEDALNDVNKRNQFKVRYLDIDNIATHFQHKHLTLIETLATTDGADLAPEEAVRTQFDRMFYSIKEIYDKLFENNSQSNIDVTSRQQTVKLPKIDLPTFDGTLKNWPSFIDLFKALVHENSTISDSEKFKYLLSCLSKDPLTIVKAIPLTGDNYPIAFKALSDRYQNTRLLASTYWQGIIDAPKMNSESAPALRKLLNIFSENLEALRNLDLPVNSWSFVLFHILIKKLDSETLKRFELQYASNEIPSYDTLTDFLLNQCIALESVAIFSTQGKQHNSDFNIKKSSNSYNAVSPHKASYNSSSCLVNTTNTSKSSCILCHKPHLLYKCASFTNRSPMERYHFAKEKNLCLNCLTAGHRSSLCKSQYTCRVCHSRHHSLLHFTHNIVEPAITSSSSPSTRVESENMVNSVVTDSNDLPSTSNPVNTLANILPSNTTVLLSTVVFEIMDSRGNYQKVRALLDSASQASFITSTCCNRLGLPRVRLSLSINGIGQMSSTSTSGVSCIIRPLDNSHQSISLDAIVLPKICPPMPTAYIPNPHWPHLSNITLADPNFNIPSNIDLLLGADVFPLIMRSGQIQGDDNQPSAFYTIFGWVLIGKISCQLKTSVQSFCVSFSSSLDTVLQKFWELEEIPQVSSVSSEDALCEKIFVENYNRDPNGRYSVILPFKNDEPSLSETRSITLRRFISLENRLLRDFSLYESYSSFMREYLDSGYMEVAPLPPLDISKSYYLPHHCVVKPDSLSTKLRVVFDASLRPPGGQSLNDNLLVGTKLQKDISTILLHFRLHRFVFTADIRQMYCQILIKPEHRDYQRILWRFSPHDPIQEFRLTTVTFGVSSAPFLAIRTLQQLADDEKVSFPRGSSILKSDLYVDDIVTGCNDLNEALSLQNELICLLRRGCFELRKWSSNHPSLLESVPVDFRQQQSLSFSKDENLSVKILGLKWFPTSDTFSFNVDVTERPCTKRTILSDLARRFDPIGFLAPVIFSAKYLIQHIWTLGLNWDQEPPDHVVKYWKQYKRELPSLSSIQIPRFLDTTSNLSCQIHAFGDASIKGYASSVYFRFTYPNDTIKVVLVTAKSKVAPLKGISLPRLELLAAVLLSNLVDFINRTLKGKIKVDQTFAWSDSSVVLAWIKSPPYRWKTFVSNRVSYIQEKVPPSCWHHVRSEENPADCASRGILPSELLSHPLWFAGPPWLYKSQNHWPGQDISLGSDSSSVIFDEERKIGLSTFISLEYLDTLLDKFSSLSKIQRIVAFCYRFISILKGSPNKPNSFTLLELNQALLCLIKRVQSVKFCDEISNIRNGKPLAKSFRKLAPFLDEDGLLRVGGRLVNSQISFDQKHPILLPRTHRLTELIIQDVHDRNLHPGHQSLRYLIMQNYWILNAKQAIRSVLSKCLKCFRVRPKGITPYMGNLPTLRVNQVKAFSCVGVDFGGPFSITLGKARGIRSQKAYLCLFVCFATKAIHVELVSDLSSEAFLAALRRFIARRGRCSIIHSDCGTNFVGANKYIVELFRNAATEEKIEWRFNPPHAPHFGGLWESGIKSVKTHLARVIGEQILTYEELYTVLVQIEALLNSRPLTELSSDPNDLSALTPGHFLTLEALTVLPDSDLTHLKVNTLTRWQLLQRLHQDFWKRWHLEYLNTLIQRQKWLKTQPELNIGKLVLIKDDQHPPLHWRLGRIIKTHPGTDGTCRVVTLRTANGVIQRPVVKICPLPG